MNNLRFCSVCASPLVETKLPTEDRPRLVCPECGHIHYVNPKIVSGALPVEDGKVWLLRRGIEPRLGFWTYPAGYQEWDESTEDAAVRETLEEIGCEIHLERLLGVYSQPWAAVVNVVYVAHFAATSARPHLTSEALEVCAFAPDQVPWEELAFSSTHAVLHDWTATLPSRRAS